jgi:polar amino acid transport system permease protein
MTFFLAAGALYLAVTLISNLVIGMIEKRALRGMVRPGGAA